MNLNKTTIVILTIAIIIIIASLILLTNQGFFKQNNTQEDKKALVKENLAQKEPQAKKSSDKAIEIKQSYEIFESDIILGKKSAPVTVIEYASLSCPHCASFYNKGFPELKTEYIDIGKVKFIYRDFPLNQPALAAAMVALCHYEKNKNATKYYKFLKSLFKSQDSWAFTAEFIQKLESIAKLNGIDSNSFKQCINNGNLQEAILKSRINAVEKIKVKSTPTFIINDEVISGYKSWKSVKKVIDKKLSEI